MTKAKRNDIIVDSVIVGGWNYSEEGKKTGKSQDSRVRVVEYRILIKFKVCQ